MVSCWIRLIRDGVYGTHTTLPLVDLDGKNNVIKMPRPENTTAPFSVNKGSAEIEPPRANGVTIAAT
jgi:hypothetical protein